MDAEKRAFPGAAAVSRAIAGETKALYQSAARGGDWPAKGAGDDGADLDLVSDADPDGGNDWRLDAIAAGLGAARDDWRRAHHRHAEVHAAGFPSRAAIRETVDDLSAALFPGRLGGSDRRGRDEPGYVLDMLRSGLDRLTETVRRELIHQRAATRGTAAARGLVARFADRLPTIRRLLDTDVEAAFRGDPAARDVDEVLLCYPGIFAMICHRLAHELYGLGLPLAARMIAEVAHSDTGIDIHPGATIGHGFFIDHGTGVVIGETAVIGDRVRLYQAVTLGARSFPTDADGALVKGIPRHPIIEDDVVIYAGATILGRVTVGRGATIGGNVWLTEDIAAGSVIHQASAERDRGAPGCLPTGTLCRGGAAPD